jgi:hypothetical protein
LHAAAPVILSQKSIFNLRVNAMEPLLGSVGSFLVNCELRLEHRDPIFGGAQLMRKLLRSIQRVSAVFFRNAGRSVEQLQNGLAGFVELIGAIRCFSSRKRDHIRLGVATTDLTMHRSALPLDLHDHIRGRAFDCGVPAPFASVP